MEFKINPAVYTGIFAVPRTVVDNNIRLASADALRVILLIFAHPDQPVSVESLAASLHKPTGEISDALLFWMERGILTDAASSPAAAPQAQAPATVLQAPAKPKKTVADLPLARPTHEQIAIRCSENEAFRELFQEAQQKLGKTIGYEGQSLLIMLHDTYDLPVEVILMLLEYAKSKGKTGYKYLASLGRDWSEKEIDSLESAEAYLEELTGTDALWTDFRRQAGMKNVNPTAKQRRYLTAWRKELGFDREMIFLAYEICIDNTGKLSVEYMDKVLRAWAQTGVRTPDDAERERRSWREKKRGGKKTAAKKESVYSSDASYDLDAYSKTAIGLQNDTAPDVHQ
ncbi:MAG: DnaD domain protein [Clostridia bacterium]|nr:DnaD domain protein [Clostridia bacterium]